MYKMKKIWGILLVLLLLCMAGCGSSPKPAQQVTPQQIELSVFAALGLKDALIDIQKEYEAKHPDVKLVYNFAATGVLQKQIGQGAPADVFITAAAKNMDDMVEQKMVIANTRRDIVSNDLVLIVNKESGLDIHSFADLANNEVKRIGIGAPETVPAGQYAIDVMKFLGIWDRVKEKAVQTKDVITVRSYVETGNVEAGVVFYTVAVTSNKVKVVAAAPKGSHPPIVFPGAVVVNSKQSQAAETFLDYLVSPEGMRAFQKYGFSPVK